MGGLLLFSAEAQRWCSEGRRGRACAHLFRCTNCCLSYSCTSPLHTFFLLFRACEEGTSDKANTAASSPSCPVRRPTPPPTTDGPYLGEEGAFPLGRRSRRTRLLLRSMPWFHAEEEEAEARAPPLRRSLRGREWRRRKRALCSPVEEPLSQDGERRASSSAHGIGPRERKREEVARERERPGGSGTERGRGSIERGGQRERKEGRWSNPEWKEEGALFAWHVASEEDQNMCSIPLY